MSALGIYIAFTMESSSRAVKSGLTPDSQRLPPAANPLKHEIREVWCYNLDKEMNQIMIAATKYPIIGMVGPLEEVYS